MLKNLYLTFHKNYLIKKLKLFIKSFGVGSFLNSEVKGTKEEYVKLYEECLKNPNRIDNFIKANFTNEDENFIVQRILELSYSADDMRPFAEDLGYDGEPFPWNPDRRAILRAELDAYYAHLYGLNRDELRYILDPTDIYDEDFPSETFRVLKNKEIEIFGEYRTQKLVLESWDRFERDEVFGKHEVA